MELDFLYVPSRDVAADATYWVQVLGARVIFAIDGMGARVAMLELGTTGPRVLLTDHLEDERTILIYRVADLDKTEKDLRARGWKRGHSLEIPHGPCVSFATPGGQRVAIYELARPQVARGFEGRLDFVVGAGSKSATRVKRKPGPKRSPSRARQ